MSAPYLEIQAADGSKQLPLDALPLTVGRHADNKLVLQDHMASRFHAVIERAGAGLVVRDLNSSNGTRLNGKPLKGGAPLNPGDAVQIGGVRLTLVDPDAPLEDVELLDEDEVEELSDDEVMEVVEDDDAPLPLAGLFDDDDNDGRAGRDAGVTFADGDSPLPIAHDDDDDAPGEVFTPAAGAARRAVTSGGSTAPRRDAESDEITVAADGGLAEEFEANLEMLAESLPDKPFGEHDIALISSRGHTVHAAAPPAAKSKKRAKREPVDVFRLILVICARGRATDIHMEPKADTFTLRVRIDGLMVDVTKLPQEMGTRLAALVKVLSDIDISQRTVVQEGHFAAKLPGSQGGQTVAGFRRADYRVSFAPAVFGQKLVIRIFDAANAPLKVSDLQLPDWMRETVRKELTKEAGMILVCGPTGSGKTTTLYALVRSSDTGRRNVVTIEDPVEVQIEGATQIPVDESQNKSFSILLRSVLRQDPDVILVGEIRDPETARIAMQAAITGHLVFSTVHTTHSIGSIFRLLDLGVEPYLVAQGLHLVLAQRLVRRLCPFCRKPVKVTPAQVEQMGPAGVGVEKVFVPNGCPRCLGTGFAGRQAFFELLSATDELRDIITTTRTMDDFKRVLEKTKFVRLDQSGYQLVAHGITSVDEIEQAVGR